VPQSQDANESSGDQEAGAEHVDEENENVEDVNGEAGEHQVISSYSS